MSDTTAPRAAAAPRTGGPGHDDDRRPLLEHLAGWALVVVVAMLLVRLHLG